MKTTDFMDVTPCNLVETSRHMICAKDCGNVFIQNFNKFLQAYMTQNNLVRTFINYNFTLLIIPSHSVFNNVLTEFINI